MKRSLSALLLSTALLGAGIGAAAAEPVKYTLDPGHSQIVFTYEHLGYSTSTGMFSGFEGEIMFDQEDPANSSVKVSFPAESMITGWDPRSQHFLQSGDFFKLGEFPEVTFESTGIEVTGEDTAKITGDLTLNGVTKSVVLDANLTQTGEYPLPPFEGKPAAGFKATTTLVRSDYNLGMFAPYVSDEVQVELSIEAMAE
ncbi:YceI family protein [Oceaniglobus roseus]|uniref:YceI family protein n=1 Tax=Oceaniglobus roseus TaxID=1737570 RepID=UPI000C7EEDB8|nr:YceI family protein [Kandeliimicrobium roseum]